MKRLILLVIPFLFAGYGGLYAQKYLEMMDDPDANFYDIRSEAEKYFENRDKGKGSGYKQYKRWEYFMAPRAYPSGRLNNPAKLALDEEFRYAYKGQAQAKLAGIAHTGNWSSLGIKNVTTINNPGWKGGIGRVNCIAFHPTDPDTIFLGTPAGGLWKSTDAGASWQCLTNGLPIMGVSGIAVDTDNPDILYILTGDGDGSNTKSIGVLKSIDGGATWLSTDLSWEATESVRGYKLLMHPNDPAILFAVTSEGIYKTTDGGINWKNNQVQAGYFFDIEFKPADPTVMYAATKDTFYKSVDSGNSWVPEYTVPTANPTCYTTINQKRIAIGVTADDPDYIYLLSSDKRDSIGCGVSDKRCRIFRSTNGGDSFNERADHIGRAQGAYDVAIAVLPKKKNKIYVGLVKVYKSTDGGVQWQEKSDNIHVDFHAFEFNGNKLYAATDGGIYRRQSGAWIPIWGGLEITQFYRFGGTPANPDLIYAGAQDNGVNAWEGSDSMELINGGDGMECIIDYSNPDIVYHSTQNGPLRRSSNGSSSMGNLIRPGWVGAGAWVTPFIMHPSNPDTLYAGYDRVYQISQAGAQWDSLGNSKLSTGKYKSLAMGTNDTQVIYAAKSNEMMVTTDGGTNWVSKKSGLPVGGAQITYISVSTIDAQKAWVSFSGYASGKKVYYTDNAGNNWYNISGSLPNVPVNCITYHDNGNDALYIGTDIGVFYKDNTLNDWIPFRNGMPSVIVNELEVSPGNNKIRAATFGRGIWESDLYGACETDLVLNNPISGYRLYEAGNTISSTASIAGGIGTEVIFQAGSDVTLQSGFQATSGNTFRASIAACSQGGIPTAKELSGTYAGPMPGLVKNTKAEEDTHEDLSVDNRERLLLYPNPFSSQVTVEFVLDETSPVSLRILDMNGREIERVISGTVYEPGRYLLNVHSDHWPEGFYFCRLETNTGKETKKVILKK